MLAVLSLVPVTWLLAAPAPPDEDFETRVDLAIERGVKYLRAEIEREPVGKRDDDVMGRTALEVYALIKGDVSVYDPVVMAAIQSLNEMQPVRVYSVSLYMMALDAALGQIETDLALVRGNPDAQVEAEGALSNGLRRRLVDMTRWLLSMRREGAGVWDYRKAAGRYDNSNTQFAVLALGVAAKRKLRVPIEVWDEIANHFIGCQAKDGPKVDLDIVVRKDMPKPKGRTSVEERHVGEEKPPEVRARGWGYQDTGQKLTMTAAGCSSLILARDYLFRSKGFPAERRARITQAIWDGLAWLARDRLNYGEWFYYALYSVEKVGDLGALEKIGDIDWYRHGADIILSRQNKDGSWGADEPHDHKRRYQTSLAMLFLNRATDLLVHSRPLFTTGKGSSEKVREGWVYVTRIQGELSVRRLFRKIRYNPQKSVLRLGEDVVKDSIALGRAPELIPHLIDVAASPYKQVQEFARKSLERISDEKYEDLNQYREWAKLWNSVVAMGRSRDAGSVGKLRELLRSTKSLSLKRQIIWAFEQIRGTAAVGDLIDELENENADYRARVYSALKFLTMKDLPFTADGPAAARREQVAAWRSWLAQNQAGKASS